MGVGSINYYSILVVFAYLTGWLIGYPFIGEQLRWLFIKPIYCIAFVLLLVLWGRGKVRSLDLVFEINFYEEFLTFFF